MPRFTRSRAPGGVAVGSTGSQVVTASSGVALAICLAWRLAVIHTPPAARPGAASAPVVGAPHDIVGDRPRARDVLLSGGSRPEGVRTLPLAVAWGVAGPADVRRAGVVVDGDDGRRTGAVIVLVGMDTDGSGGGGEARVAGVGRWFARRHLVIGEQRRQDLEHRGVLAVQGRIEQVAYPVCLRRRLVEVVVLEYVHPRSEVLDDDLVGGGHVDEERVIAVGDQQPARVVRARIDGRAEGLDGGGRGGMGGEGEGQLTAGSLGRIGTVAQWPIC